MPQVSPVNDAADEAGDAPGTGVAIALSGGGYRAMLYHAGSLWRLGQLGFFGGADLLHVGANGETTNVGKLERISSVSGGSITAATLALAWPELARCTGDEFDRVYLGRVVGPLRKLASVTLAGTNPSGVFGVIKSVVLPGRVSEHIARSYDRQLFGGKTLQDLPDSIRFVFNASNLQSGAVWRFSKPYMRDWRVGEVRDPTLSLAKVVAASSAFPPVLAPAVLSLRQEDFTAGSGVPALHRPPYTTKPTLADGGVYDNLGLETCYKRYKTLFVSNAGKPFGFVNNVPGNWISIGNRCIDLMDNQVLSLRKRLLVQALKEGRRQGAFWDIQQDIAVHRCTTALPCPLARTKALSEVATDLAAKDDALQMRLINWGYASADAAVRGWFNGRLPIGAFPYPAQAV